MTARPDGAAEEGGEDTLFDDPVEVVGEELEGLLRLSPPSTSSTPVLAIITQHAIESPETIRDFIEETAARLAKESGCQHEAPLVTWKQDREAATTCGRLQAGVLSRKVLDRQMTHDGDPGYCLAKRVRNQVYYDTSIDLDCHGKGNQCSAGTCMKAALQVFAGEARDGIPSEIVRAMCKYYSVLVERGTGTSRVPSL
ncbi:unnamed protein product [Ectocarpus sp. CCAP 1310/34]|nr:unnamed protein product [Ectocarpus sp. CCAP 1310/34]